MWEKYDEKSLRHISKLKSMVSTYARIDCKNRLICYDFFQSPEHGFHWFLGGHGNTPPPHLFLDRPL